MDVHVRRSVTTGLRQRGVDVLTAQEDGTAQLSRTEEKLVEMTNGCICCTLRDDFLQEVTQLAQAGRFD